MPALTLVPNPPGKSNSLDIANPCWLFARTCRLFNRTGLLVYKSVVMQDTDPMFKEVRKFLEGHKVRIVYKGIFKDAELMFREGELTIQLLLDKDDGDISVDPEMVEELRSEGLRIVKEMIQAN